MVGMNKLVSVSPDHLFRSVAQHPFDRGTGIEYCPFRAQEENDVIGVLDQRAEALFARLNRLFRPLAPDELADLAADRGERSELLLIRFPDPATEELDNPQGLPAKQDRASKAGVQPGSGGGRASAETGILCHIGDPERLACLPDLPGATFTGGAGGFLAGRVEFGHVDTRCMPDTIATQALRLLLTHAPERAPIPVHRFADCPQQMRACLSEAVGFGENAGDAGLSGQALLSALLVADVFACDQDDQIAIGSSYRLRIFAHPEQRAILADLADFPLVLLPGGLHA